MTWTKLGARLRTVALAPARTHPAQERGAPSGRAVGPRGAVRRRARALGRLHEQPELARARRRLDARAAAELGEDVAHVHVDRARAEEQLARRSRGSCARRRAGASTSSSRRERPGAVVVGGGAAAEPRARPTRRARAISSAACVGQRPGAERGARSGSASASRSSAGSRSPAAASATPARSWICARSNGMSRRWRAAPARAPSCSAAVVRRRRRQRGLAERVGERGERVGMAGRAPRSRDSASAHARASRDGAVARRSSTPPSAGPRPRSGGPRCAPSARARSGSARPPRRGRPSASASQASAAARVAAASRRRPGARRCRAQRSSSGRARARLAAEGVDRAEDAVGDERVVGRTSPALELAAQLDGLRPSRRARAARRPCSSGRRARARRRRRCGTGRARCRAPRARRRSRRAISSAVPSRW